MVVVAAVSVVVVAVLFSCRCSCSSRRSVTIHARYCRFPDENEGQQAIRTAQKVVFTVSDAVIKVWGFLASW